MSIQQEDIAVLHPQHTFPFVIPDFAKSVTAGSLYRIATSAIAKIDAVTATMPWGGCIIGLGVLLSAAKTAGVLSFVPTIGGVAKGPTVTIVTNAAQGYAKCRYGLYRFVAGDLLGCTYTSDGSMAPNGTADAIGEVYVIFDRADI